MELVKLGDGVEMVVCQNGAPYELMDGVEEEIKKVSKWDIAGEIKERGIKIYG